MNAKHCGMGLFRIFAFWLCFHFISIGYSAEVMFLDSMPKESAESRQLDLACQFYGLNLRRIAVPCDPSAIAWIDSMRASQSSCFIIDMRALNDLQHKEIYSYLCNKENVNILVMGIASEISPELITLWSAGAINSCQKTGQISGDAFYKVSNDRAIAFELAGQIIPISNPTSRSPHFFSLQNSDQCSSIIEIAPGQSKNSLPIFVCCAKNRAKVFLQASQNPIQNELPPNSWSFNRENFWDIAPVMMFLKYALGEQCWHSPGDYANFTIDDPWLIEPYGCLSYNGLLKEMELANFHTTIAFIPYNFDRSSLEVASLFRSHPDKFSICIHGNNHDHWEFYRYESDATNLRRAKPLADQEENIRQALARMETFQRKLSVNYDRVMVFPQGIAPQKTLALLKKYHFLATCNGGQHGNVPLDVEMPIDPIWQLRSIYTQYENFPSLKRYMPEKEMPRASQNRIAIDLFLDNPLLLWAHHDFFRDGSHAFNKTAQAANTIQPDLQWNSLGEIAQHLYLERRRDDGDYDIKAWSSNLIIENHHHLPVRYFLQKEESFDPPIKKLTLNGHPYPYEKSLNNLSLTFILAPEQASHIVIEYEHEVDWANIATHNTDPHIARLRKLSDLRDRTLSRFWLGQLAVRYYYQTGLFQLGLVRLAVITVVLSLGMSGISWQLKNMKKRAGKRKTEMHERASL